MTTAINGVKKNRFNGGTLFDNRDKGKNMQPKLKIIILLALFNWLVMAAPLKAETKLTKLVNKIRPAVVTVIVYDINQVVTNIGSGFL